MTGPARSSEPFLTFLLENSRKPSEPRFRLRELFAGRGTTPYPTGGGALPTSEAQAPIFRKSSRYLIARQKNDCMGRK
jgi:hypothetical protein